MNLFRTTAAVLAISTALLTLPAQAEEMQQNVSGNTMYNADAPSGFVMVGDLLIARPILIAMTAIGAAAFVVSLPFTVLGGNMEEAGQSLVSDPAREAFVRCLGCTSSKEASY